jgi:uncharacterized protein (DUF427 family)
MSEQARGRVRIEDGHKRVRVYLEGELVADTLRPVYVWEGPHYPQYYIHAEDVRAELKPNGETVPSPSRGEGRVQDVLAGDKVAAGAARLTPESPFEELRGLVRFEFGSFDWYEENEPIYTHPRDPYTRVDILHSSRKIRVELDGEVLAESNSPMILFETGLPARYYIPITDIRQGRLRPSATRTDCPYKGSAEYFSVEAGGTVHPDLVWYYRTPLPESQKIAGLASFYNEKVDIYVDDVLQERPRTKFQ